MAKKNDKKKSSKSPEKTTALSASLSGALPGRASDTTLFSLFSLPTILTRPTYLAKSAWLEHVPFAFWLMEAQAPRIFVELGTHWGVSYFAFCQAAERMGLDLRAFAVDTWEGDEHAGFYGPEVFEKVSEHNNALYSEFSRLVRSGFDEAREHFEDDSIDLLHIDGCHDYDAVKGDFEGWLPKLSDRAIVVLHDSNVRERGFGVHRLVRELRARYPVFEFTHGHGLAVIGVGAQRNASFERLFATEDDPVARKAIHATFSRLGRACADSQMARHNAEERRAAEAEAEWLARRVGELEAVLGDRAPAVQVSATAPARIAAPDSGAEAELRAEIARLSAALAQSEDRLAATSAETAATPPDPAVPDADYEHLRAESRDEINRLSEALIAAQDAERAALEKLEALRDAGPVPAPHDPAPETFRAREIDRLTTEAEQFRARIAELQGDLHDRHEEISALSRIVMTLQDNEASSEARVNQAQRDARAAEQAAEQAVEQARRDLAEMIGRSKTAQEKETELRRALTEAEDQREISETRRQDLANDLETIRAENTQIRAALAKAREDVSTLTQKAQYWEFENEALRKSTSWRLSAPLRAASQAIRRPKKD
ncbi:class I SAM-dependent methyltransferase [Oceanicola sp. 22II-s10i]|uniref:class I SAM-dependent methyltransferase n=1 Tax=Oceanicola sp. 22II-s10i TaxID=1317116 RepID=UPI000B522951|nr:class I SAM-dependent methyltransferase [Oceanicola sp. 22II-s10i]